MDRKQLISRGKFVVFLIIGLVVLNVYFSSTKIEKEDHLKELTNLQKRIKDLEDQRIKDLEDRPGYWGPGLVDDKYVSKTKKLKVLFLTTLRAYNVMMDRNFYHFSEAAKEHPLVEAHLWGPGLEGWNSEIDYLSNIKEKFGKHDYFDVAILWGGFHVPYVNALGQYTLIAYRFEECWAYRCADTIVDMNLSLALFNYPDEMALYKNISYRRVYVHSPHTGSKRYFYQPPEQERDIPVLSIGAVSAAYPLRLRLRDMILEGKIKGGVVRKHPGYTDTFTEEELKTHGIDVEWHNRQVNDYSAQLGRSKITFVTSSIYKYALQKYPEVALAGSLLMGDIPAEREEEFKQYVIELDPDWDDKKIIETINYWLTHEEERLQKVKIGQEINLRRHTYKNAVDTLIQAYKLFIRREYGMYYGNPFKVVCKATARGHHYNDYCADSSDPQNG